MKRFAVYPFLVVLFFLPLQTVYLLREPMIGGEKWQYGTMGIYATDILLILVLVLGAYCARYYVRRRTRSNFEGRKRSFSLLFARKQRASEKAVFAPRSLVKSFLYSIHISTRVWSVFFLWTGLSVFWAPDRVLAGYFFVKLLLAAGVFFLSRSFGKRETGLIITALFTGAILVSVLGIGQFLSQSAFASSWLGMSGQEAWQAGTSVLKNESGRWLRAYGTFPHPNMLGGYLGVVLVLGIGYLTQSALSIKKRLFLEGGSIVILLGLLLTFSRMAWLGILLGISLVGFHTWREDEPRIWERFLQVFFVLGLAGFIFGCVLREQIFPRFDTVTVEREKSVTERITAFQDAWTLIGKYPLIGVGAGNFTAQSMKENPGRPIWGIQPAHNVLLLIWVELGVIGLALFIGSIGSFVSLKSLFFSLQSAGFVVLLPSLLLDHWLWTSHFGILFFAFLSGYTLRSSREFERVS